MTTAIACFAPSAKAICGDLFAAVPPLPDLAMSGAILVDQARSIDRFACSIRINGEPPMAVVADVQAKLAVLLGIQR